MSSRHVAETHIKNQVKTKEYRQNRLRRKIETGMISGRILSNGVAVITSPKGIQNWYDTRTLITKVTEIFDRNEAVTGRRTCSINGKWQLQIRGKHLRRLLKAMPTVKYMGRMLIELG